MGEFNQLATWIARGFLFMAGAFLIYGGGWDEARGGDDSCGMFMCGLFVQALAAFWAACALFGEEKQQ